MKKKARPPFEKKKKKVTFTLTKLHVNTLATGHFFIFSVTHLHLEINARAETY